MQKQNLISKLTIILLAITIGIFSSCSGTRKDCHGMKKHRQSNGMFM